jgi:hypothetical protein
MTNKIVVNIFATVITLSFAAIFIGQILVTSNVYEQQQAHGQKEEEEGMAKLFEQDTTATQQQPTTDEEADEQVGAGGGGEEEQGTPNVFTDPFSSSDSLSLISHRISRNTILDTETLDINSEIQNNGTEPLDFVRVTATFYDANNSILGSDFTYTEPDTLDPGQSAPFKLNVGLR